MSQSEFAQAVRLAGRALGLPNLCTKRLVQKWELGEHASCQPEYLKVLAMVTGVAAAELGFAMPPETPEESEAAEETAEESVAGQGDAPVRAGGEVAVSSSSLVAGRSPNLAVRRARLALRMSQSEFADWVREAGEAMGLRNRCTKRLVQKWESGESASCHQDYVRVLEAVTGLGALELGFHLRAEAMDAAVGDAVSGGTAGKLAGEDAAALATQGFSAGSAGEGSAELWRDPMEHPTTVGAGTADLVEAGIACLFDLEHHSPARLLAPSVVRRLATVTVLLGAAGKPQVKRALRAAGGAGALLAGWLAFDRGDSASAYRWWEEAASAAEATMDAGLFAGCLIFQSYAAARRGDPGTAWQLAHTASRHTPEDRRATAWATARAARYAAQSGELKAAESAMREALQIGDGLLRAVPGDGSRPWTRFFDRAMLLAEAAHTAALLGDQNAVEYATRAVDVLGAAAVKARAIVLAEAALTTAIVGEYKLCLDYGTAAAPLTREMDVSIAADLLREVVTLALPNAHEPAVQELLPQLDWLTRPANLIDAAEREQESTAGRC